MQKLFKNCYEMDRKCYEKYALSEDLLMEHASSSMESYIRDNFEVGSSVLIVAGSGNNGADGITLARLLSLDYDVSLFLPLGAKSKMAKLQLDRAKRVGVEVVNGIKEADIIVDALFGAGLSRALSEELIELLEELNSLSGFKIACDIPTGIDERGTPLPIAFRADITITMGALKEALYQDLAKDFVGEVICANLGVSRELYEDDTLCFLLEESDFNPPYRTTLATHKGSYGHSAIFCGEKEGAGIISATASARFGSGLTTLVIHDRVIAPPFLMKSTSVPPKANAIAIGMGLGDFFEMELLEKEVIDSNLPIVLDADALSKKELLQILHQEDRKVVITPHPAEFVRLWKILAKEEITTKELQENRLKFARAFSARFPNSVLLLKGANPIIAHLGELYINPLGSVTLAKGGSGDVLSGLIVALLAQGYEALDATICASLALAIASKRYKGANYSMLATDLIEEIAKL